MTRELRAEFLKQLTTRTTLAMFGAVVGLVLLAAVMPAAGVAGSRSQKTNDMLQPATTRAGAPESGRRGGNDHLAKWNRDYRIA